MTTLTEVTRAFRAMNTDVNAAVCAPAADTARAAAALAAVETFFRGAEARLSRFLPDSELSALNRAGRRPFPASTELYDVVAAALDFAARTGGRFDPAILPGLVAAGYDRSFETLASRPAAPPAPARQATWREVKLDPRQRTITLPADGALDLGGIGKGWTADRAAAGLRRFTGFVIDAGGDIVADGVQAEGSPWTIGVADPFDGGRDLGVLALHGGAVCTSSTLKRSWQSGGGAAHHIIDPRTGRPAFSGVVAATVRADTAAAAEVLAKTAVIMGERDALSFINGWPGAAGLLVLENGAVRYTNGFRFA
jgi:thiamine biosynthesis lipoprotein